MQRRLLLSFVKSSSSKVSTVNEEHDNSLEDESKLPVSSLKVKRVDHYYSR